MNEISALVKEAPESSLSPPPCEDTTRNCDPEEVPSLVAP